MSDMGKQMGGFLPEKAPGGLFGNKVTGVAVFEQGIALERKKGRETLPFSGIGKILARNYASPTPTFIHMEIHPIGGKKAIEFSLHPNRRDVNLLLGVFSDYQLGGSAFPGNLGELEVDLGGLGASIWYRKGYFFLGERKIPVSELLSFTTGPNGFYQMRLRDVKQPLGISPDYAPNILTSIKVLSVIEEQNRVAG